MLNLDEYVCGYLANENCIVTQFWDYPENNFYKQRTDIFRIFKDLWLKEETYFFNKHYKMKEKFEKEIFPRN